MSSRRARIKVAPNLAAVRSKGRTLSQKCRDHEIEPKVDKNLCEKRSENVHQTRSSCHSDDVLSKYTVANHTEDETEREALTPNVPETVVLDPKPILTTGKFVNGKYIPTKKPSESRKLLRSPDMANFSKESTYQDSVSKSSDSCELNQHELSAASMIPAPQSATIRRFLGLKNKFKPNLFARSRLDEVVKRTRKISVGEKEVNSSQGKDDSLSTRTNVAEKCILQTSKGKVEHEVETIKLGGEDRNNSNRAYVTKSTDEHMHSPDTTIAGFRRLRSKSGSHSSGDESKKCLKPPPKAHRTTTIENAIPTPLFDVDTATAIKPRIRRLTETRQHIDKINLGLKRRKTDSKRRFSNGIPGRQTMTMFDLIYYNPDNGTEMTSDELESSVSVKKTMDLSEKVDDPDADSSNLHKAEEESLPVPQVKVGVNGEIILDESSTMLETTAARKAKEDLSNTPIVVENSNKFTNYGTWSKKRRYSDWSEKETFKFYRALSIVGSDFSMMESMFKKRTRQELKLKFKKEEKVNGPLVDKCLKQKGQFSDIGEFMEEDTDDDTEKRDKPDRGRKRKTKSKVTARRRFSNRGMYDSSSGGEEADISETSRSPARKRISVKEDKLVLKTKGNSKLTKTPTDPATTTTLATSPQSTSSTSTNMPMTPLEKLPGVQFPPALLAANPGLAGAKPGSLVVVASPSKTDPCAQLLHVYMVSEKRKKGPDSSSPQPAYPSPRPRPREVARLSIDPAVVRAVDRKRSSVEQNQHSGAEDSANTRTRTFSEGSIRRHRTFSEGNVISPSRLRTLSGSSQDRQQLTETESDNLEHIRDPKHHSRNTGTVASVSLLEFKSDQDSTADALINLPIARKSKPT